MTTNKIILEVRAGAGGDEAAIFAGDLARMYQRYAAKRGWSFSVLDANQTTLQGYKSLVAEINGKGVYEAFKHESGVHRVQRVPETEKIGRVHTSTATVAVLPEAGEKCGLWSSYDRASRYDAATGKYVNWDANGDGGGFIRTEGNQVVMAEMNGPGCIWRIWSRRVR